MNNLPAWIDTAPAPAPRVKPRGRTARRTKSLPARWWSVDPGEKHVGRAVWGRDELVSAEEITPEQLLEELSMPPSLVVIESFTLLSPKWGSEKARQAVSTIKLIGATEALVRLWSGEVVEQQPSVRHVAQRSPYWTEIREKVPANPHARSAAAHGLYYLRFAS